MMRRRRGSTRDDGLHADIPIRVRNRSLGRLAKRLAVGGLAISLVLGGIAFAFEVARLRGHFATLAVTEAKEFVRQARPPDPAAADAAPAVQAALDTFLAQRQHIPAGHFILAEVYDTSRNLVARSLVEQATAPEEWMDAHPHRFPAGTTPWVRLALVGDGAYVQVVTLLLDGGRPIGFFEGVYAVAPAIAAAVVGDAARTAALVALAVIATSLLLYPVIRSLLRRLTDGALDLLHANLDTLAVLGGAIAKRDGETGIHSYRVTLIAVRLAEAAGLQPKQIRGLIKGAFLHDVGKIGIPDAVLLKPGPLDAGETAAMRDHVQDGLEIVGQADWLADAAEVVGCHHEWFDGTGYPNGLADGQIPVTARVFAIADVFDALTSPRPYKPPLTLRDAMATIEKGRGSHFDPHLLDLFNSIADAVYADICRADDASLQGQLHRSTRRYFAETVLV